MTERRTIQHKRRGDSSELTERARTKLLSGHDWSFLAGAALDDDELAALWRKHRGELLAGHIREHPGSRPWAWWQFDASGPRRKLRRDAPVGLPGSPMFKGMPAQLDGMLDDGDYETEHAYLDRLGILTAAERKTLKR